MKQGPGDRGAWWSGGYRRAQSMLDRLSPDPGAVVPHPAALHDTIYLFGGQLG